jgi:hypothetical protein
MQCEFAQQFKKGTNNKRIKYFGRSENFVAEPLTRAQQSRKLGRGELWTAVLALGDPL